MENIDDILAKRTQILNEIDSKIKAQFTKAVALLFTDIVGSTQYFEQYGDIAGKAMLKAHNDLLFPIIESYKGTIIKTIGDSIMTSFPDPEDAVRCAIAMQEALATYNQKQSRPHQILVRMGLHWGEAVVDGKDLFGDMVNTASRLEAKAEAAEILISGQLKGKITAPELEEVLVFIGNEQVKGKKQSLDIYVVNWERIAPSEIKSAWQKRLQSKVSPPLSETGRKQVVIHGNVDLKVEAASLKPLSLHGNPYLNRVMVPHPELFFGRQTLVRRIFSRINADRPQSVSLVGERRIGKSSLLNYLSFAEIRLKNLLQPESFIFIHLDFQQLQATRPSEIISYLFKELEQVLGPRIELNVSADYEGLKLLAESLLASNLKLIILADEFEAVTKNPELKPDFYAFLRSLANNYPLAFITASARNLKDMCASHEISDSPFFNIFATLQVGLFTREEAFALISEPSARAGVPLAPLATQILTEGGRYPFFLQMMCSAWYEYLSDEQKSADDFSPHDTPKRVIQTFLEEAEPHFEYIAECFNDEEKIFLKNLLENRLTTEYSKVSQELLKQGYIYEDEEGRLQPFSRQFKLFLTRYFRL